MDTASTSNGPSPEPTSVVDNGDHVHQQGLQQKRKKLDSRFASSELQTAQEQDIGEQRKMPSREEGRAPHGRVAGLSDISEVASQMSQGSRKKARLSGVEQASASRSDMHVPIREQVGEDVLTQEVTGVQAAVDCRASFNRSVSATDVRSQLEKRSSEFERDHVPHESKLFDSVRNKHATHERRGSLNEHGKFRTVGSGVVETEHPGNRASCFSTAAVLSPKEVAVSKMTDGNSNLHHSSPTHTNPPDAGGRALSSAASSRSGHRSASMKGDQRLREVPSESRHHEQSTASNAKRKYNDRVPSRFCHICQRKQGAVKHIVCCNIHQGSCRKVVCEMCFDDNDWNFEETLQQSDTWICPHCLGACPERAQCKTYSKTNDRRRNGTLKAKKGKAEGKVNEGSNSRRAHAPELDSNGQVTAGPGHQGPKQEVDAPWRSQRRNYQPRYKTAQPGGSRQWPEMEADAGRAHGPSPGVYTGLQAPPSLGAFPVYYEYTYAPPLTEPLPKYSIFDGLPF